MNPLPLWPSLVARTARVHCLLVIVFATVAGAAETIPPSPSTVPGLRLLDPPAFTHWPAIAYTDEARNAAFTVPFADPVIDAKRDRPVRYATAVPRAGSAGSIGWSGGAVLPFTLPSVGEGTGGLIDLVLTPGTHTALLDISTTTRGAAPEPGVPADPPGASSQSLTSRSPTLTGNDAARLADPAAPLTLRLPLRVVPVADEWPMTSLRGSYPVDAQGAPVVLLLQRRNADQERKLGLLHPSPPRGRGRALLVGDPLEALGTTAWDGLDADLRPALDPRLPQHAVLVALASALNRAPSGGAALQPRTLVWSPGNQALTAGTWTTEEERLLGAIKVRCDALGFRPRLVLLLPPWPVEFLDAARTRRNSLRKAAGQLGWVVLDAARVAGDADDANRVGEQVFTASPTGPAQTAIRDLLAEELAR
jgi:hypothetical protein